MRWPWALAVLLVLAAGVARSDDTIAIDILRKIAKSCETDGLAACEPQVRGMDPVFAYDRTYRAMKEVEADFVAFVRKRYSMPDFTMKMTPAHVDPRIEVSIAQRIFDSSPRSVKAATSGYELEYDGGIVVSLKNENGTWVVHFPRELSERAEAVNDYILAALLKRAIMVYRQLEAELLGHDYEELARRLGEDMTPLVVAVLRRDDLVAQVPDWRQRLEGVMAFYRQFDTVESMKAHIEAARASN